MKLLLGSVLGGAAAPTGGYTGFVEGTPIALPVGSFVGNAERTVAAPPRSVGDIMIAIAANGPNVPGMGSVTLRTPTFQIWSSTGGVLNFNSLQSRFNLGIFPRIATGDSEDNCLIFGQGSPSILHVIVLTGNQYAGALSGITVDNENSQNTSDSALFRENMPGAALWTFKIAASIKDNTADDTVDVVGVDSGATFMRGINTGLNFNSMSMGIAYRIEPAVFDPGVGNFSESGGLTAFSTSVSATFRSGDS
ncbi:MAG: hypothetical protein AMJ84_00185 [Acidithiobacillales bacterium SM23_46]|nr:MAG: hypothetical protein AMJ84_00185 [Acidithiobacillales bacterium SM23_46]KPL29026.1 MAG: hypothetical protein AMJ72_00265 [Acidithiobacillales bacterium SM1_46]